MPKALAVLYEHPDWFEPLFAALERRKVACERVDAANLALDCSSDELPWGAVFPRVSSTAPARGNAGAIALTQELVAQAEALRVPVINGSTAHALEFSKLAQLRLMKSLDCATPRTVAVAQASQVSAAAQRIGYPLIFKPSIGGAGQGVQRFENADELAETVRTRSLDFGAHELGLLQAYVPPRDGVVHRLEFLEGKLLYGIRTLVEADSFNICPAEVGMQGGVCEPVPRVTRFEPPEAVVRLCERVMKAGEIDLGSIEYLVSEEDGTPVFYDINVLSNFVRNPESLLGFDPYEPVIDMLVGRLRN